MPQEQGSPITPQALDSLFIAYYDSQGYGGGIRTRLHTGFSILFNDTQYPDCIASDGTVLGEKWI
jgi:hypothetical protein